MHTPARLSSGALLHHGSVHHTASGRPVAGYLCHLAPFICRPGISGILWGSIAGQDRNWRGLFLAGLFLGGAVTHMVIGQSIPSPLRSTAMAPRHKRHACRDRNSHGRWLYQRARSLRIRPSRPRSLVATLTFMAFGVITVYLLQLINGVNL